MFAKVDNGVVVKFPYNIRDFKADNPNVSPPADMSALGDYGVVPVVQFEQPAPSDPMTVRVIKGPVTEIAGVWTETWVEEALSAEEQAERLLDKDEQDTQDALKIDPWMINFKDMSISDAEAYIDSSVTDLASAKAVLRRLAVICLLLVKDKLR